VKVANLSILDRPLRGGLSFAFPSPSSTLPHTLAFGVIPLWRGGFTFLSVTRIAAYCALAVRRASFAQHCQQVTMNIGRRNAAHWGRAFAVALAIYGEKLLDYAKGGCVRTASYDEHWYLGRLHRRIDTPTKLLKNSFFAFPFFLDIREISNEEFRLDNRSGYQPRMVGNSHRPISIQGLSGFGHAVVKPLSV